MEIDNDPMEFHNDLHDIMEIHNDPMEVDYDQHGEWLIMQPMMYI